MNSILRNRNIKTIAIAAIAMIVPVVSINGSMAAENLSLRKGISFVNDKELGFPVVADKLNDATIEAGKATLLFFGASGDLNTARQAKRLVNVYNKLSKRAVKFIVINVDKPANQNAKNLIKKHYKGYIPCQVVLDTSGQSTWNKVGEVSEREVVKQLSKQIKN